MIDFSSLKALDGQNVKTTVSAPPYHSLKSQALSDENRAKLENAARVYVEYQANTLKSDTLQCEINRGLKSGENIYSLFLKAVQAISLMTNNSVFYDVAKKDLLAIYGIGLGEPPVLQLELNEVQSRLDKLKQAAKRKQDDDELSRITTAIQYHEKMAERLKNRIANFE